MANSCIPEIAIQQLHSRYVDAAWRKDFDAFGECFAEDAEWRIFGKVLKGRAEAVDFFKDIMKDTDHLLMTLQAPILDVQDDTASGRTYFTALNHQKDGSIFTAIGTYYERFKVERGQWRIAWRLFQFHYTGAQNYSGKFGVNPDFGPPPAMPPMDAIPQGF